MFRRSPRVLALLGAAGAIALVTAIVVASDLASIHRRAADLGPLVHAVVATREIPLGTTLRASDVGEREIHREELPPGALEHSTTTVGRVVQVPIVRGGFVTAGNLASRDRTGLDGAIPYGMRAMRVVATNAVRPRIGAAVDVLATFDTSKLEGSSQTVIVASGVRVVATDGRMSGANTGTSGDSIGVTLLLASGDAQKVAFAQVNGVVTIVLVPPEDAARR